jgi:hypothetical protein
MAVTGFYTDWYSPMLPLMFALARALKLGTGLSAVTLCQAVLGAVGVYLLAMEVLRYLSRHRVPVGRLRWAALATLVLLLTPFTALLYYLAHYRNDSLAAVFLAWAVAGWLRVERVWNASRVHGSSRGGVVFLIVPIVFSVLTVAVRYNAVVILPVLLLLVAVIVGRTSRRAAVVTGLILIVGPPALQAGLIRLANPKRDRPARQLMAMDLVGMCVEREELLSKMPYTAKYLIVDRYRAAYVPGFYLGIIPGAPDQYRTVREGYLFDDYKKLSRDFWRAVRAAPLTWLAVKGRATFASLLDAAPHWHHRVIDPNPFGLTFHESGRDIRSLVLYIDELTYNDPVLRFLCARHLPWLTLNIVLVLPALAVAGRSRARGATLTVALLLLPLAYYTSHLVAVTAHDYRFMFPATLLMQVYVVCALLLAARTWVNRQVARWDDHAGLAAESACAETGDRLGAWTKDLAHHGTRPVFHPSYGTGGDVVPAGSPAEGREC